MNEFQKRAIRNTCLAVGIPAALITDIILCTMYKLWAEINFWILVSFCLLTSFGFVFISCLEWYYKFKLKGCVTKYEELQYIDKYFTSLVTNESIEITTKNVGLAVDFLMKARRVKVPKALKWYYNL